MARASWSTTAMELVMKEMVPKMKLVPMFSTAAEAKTMR